MGFRFSLEQANWLAHMLQPTGATPQVHPVEADETLGHFLSTFAENFYTSRPDAYISLREHPVRSLRWLREFFRDVPWIALLIPSGIIKAASAPQDRKTGKTLDYQDWMLDSYIRVGHELNWITYSAKQIADVLKEFRNYVHPAKELRHGISLANNDSTIFWNVTKALVRQLLLSAPKP